MSGLRCAEFFVDLEHVRPTNHLVDGTESEFSHVATKLLSEIIEEIDDLFRLTREFGTKLWILSSDTDRASID